MRGSQGVSRTYESIGVLSIVSVRETNCGQKSWTLPVSRIRCEPTGDTQTRDPSGGAQVRRFHLIRHEDISGISGTGRVAEGVQFHDGQCVLSWFSQFHTLGISPNIEEDIALHGHDGRTVIEWVSDVEALRDHGGQ
jgi:hypothetical protein